MIKTMEKIIKSKNIFVKGLVPTISIAFLAITFFMFGAFNFSLVSTATAETASSDLNPVSTVLEKCTATGANCGWEELIDLANAIVAYGVILIGFALVLVLLWTGFLYLTSGGDSSKVKKSREMLNKVMWGTIFTLCGWLIVSFILKGLSVNEEFYKKIIQL